MKYLFLILIFSLNAYALENKLLPFTTDGCSKIPDANLTDCCKVHDLAYWKGGTEQERIDSDKKLSSCVIKKTNPFFGNMFYWGVRMGGSPALSTSFRWGYGWIYKRGYQALNQKERKLVKLLEPKDPTLVPISSPKLNIKQRPVLFGNYCFDQIHEILSSDVKDPTVSLSTSRDAYQVVVKVSLDDKNILFTYKNTKWKECHTPQFEAKLPKFYKAVYFE
ncbi:MAG: hypothetical protein ACJAT2_000870 [Bacteriovoracaceae bacterium]|jgi:hypothetical protein